MEKDNNKTDGLAVDSASAGSKTSQPDWKEIVNGVRQESTTGFEGLDRDNPDVRRMVSDLLS